MLAVYTGRKEKNVSLIFKIIFNSNELLLDVFKYSETIFDNVPTISSLTSKILSKWLLMSPLDMPLLSL